MPLAVLSLCLALPGVVSAQDVDPEWPCIQRLVETISPAIMWPLPVDEAMSSEWKTDEEVRQLARRLGDLETYTDADRAAVEAFAGSLAAEEKEHRLNLLAVGILEVANEVRKLYISGIKRYTRQQIAIADQIESTLNELSLQEESQNGESAVNREEIVSTLRWHERVYDQREAAIRLLCEQPVEREESLSDVLRDVAQYLP